MHKLKPCPFCGSNDDLHFDSRKNDCGIWYHYYRCDQCTTKGPEHPDEEMAELAWNTRKIERNPYVLTTDEQSVLRKALRKSVKIIFKGDNK